ncbi:MAG: acetate kinase [Cyanobacteria bacterium P01_A01_bin.37]
MNILVLNAGSSSQKSCLYSLLEDVALPPHPPGPRWEATIDWTAQSDSGLMIVKANGISQERTLASDDKTTALATMLQTLVEGETAVLDALADIHGVGHRVVHGGAEYSAPTRVTPEVKLAIARLIPLAPAHNPANLEGIEAIEQTLGDVPQVVVFDTAFHSQMPKTASTYPIPYQWTERGIRRYGFHGISHDYCAHRAAQMLQTPLESLKLIICHLGNGGSLSAVNHGHSIDTTMGFTPLEGLMMGSRSGSIDPAILIHLMRDHGVTPDQLDTMLNKDSGLKGVSGISSDMREIQKAVDEGSDRAKLAIDLYLHRLKSCIGSMLMSLEGLDALIFTAGIGEHAPAIRAKTCDALTFLGLGMDADKNTAAHPDCDISTPESTSRVLVIHTEEDWAIAQSCWRLLTLTN